MVTFFEGVPAAVPAFSIAFTISIPSRTSPKTTCRPSSYIIGQSERLDIFKPKTYPACDRGGDEELYGSAELEGTKT